MRVGVEKRVLRAFNLLSLWFGDNLAGDGFVEEVFAVAAEAEVRQRQADEEDGDLDEAGGDEIKANHIEHLWQVQL